MKTLKEWYDSLSTSAQVWIENNCSAWFDKNQADYYKKPLEFKNDKELHEFLTGTNATTTNVAIIEDQTLADHYAIVLRASNNIPDDVADDAILKHQSSSNKSTWLYVKDENKRIKAFKYAYGNYAKRLTLRHYLYLIKDFSNIQIDWSMCETPSLTTEVIEIIGMDEARKVLEKSNMSEYTISQMVKPGKPNVLFDELFFCKDSALNFNKKVDILDRLYASYNNTPNEELVEDFFRRIVAVDHGCLRFLIKIVQKYPAIAMKLYEQKKPTTELTGTEVMGEQYRYSKELRKLFIIAHACALKRVSKVKCTTIKDVAPLLKIYAYNWDDIYDALYPEDSSRTNYL